MGLFEHFPYTNMHELNLSWLLSAMKKLQEDYEAFKAQVEETVEAFRLQMAGWEERIADLEASWAALQAEWVSFRAEISGQMDGWEDRISGLESAWTAYQSSMDAAFNEFEATVTSLISGWDDRISTLETSWTNYQATIDSAMQSFEESINSAMQSFEAEIRDLVDGLPDKVANVENTLLLTVVSEKFTQNGAVGLMGRQVYTIGNVVQGTLRFRDGWTGEQNSLIVDVADLSLPGYGEYQIYCFPDRGSEEPADNVYIGWIGPEITPKRGGKNEKLTSKPENIVEPKKTKAGGYIWNIPECVKAYIIANPAGSIVLTFKYIPVDKEA